jgi:5-hydroxyisourate hydrolase
MSAGKLTTHVLDTARGKPAAGMKIELWATPTPAAKTLVRQLFTNADGRTNEPLLQGEFMRPGCYTLMFYVGGYFLSAGVDAGMPPFLDIVPVRFTINDAAANYHVPLLVSPWAYSTYRGS